MSEIESTITASSRMIMRPCASEGPTPDGYYPPNGSGTSDATGNVVYLRPGLVEPYVPTPYYSGTWYFAEWHLSDGSVPAGFVDVASSDVENCARCLVIGPGTMTIYLRDVDNGANGRQPSHLDVYLFHIDGMDIISDSEQLGLPGTSDVVVVVPNDDFCYHWVDVHPIGPTPCDRIGFGGFTWDTSDWARKFAAIGGHVTYAAEMAGGR